MRTTAPSDFIVGAGGRGGYILSSRDLVTNDIEAQVEGAQLDGILRSHQRASNGTLRDTAVYSITAAEWPTVKAHLDWQLARPR